MPGSRYRKSHIDISTLKKDSQEYWEEILKREGLSMSRGLYPQRLSHGWQYFDSDGRNADCSKRALPASPDNGQEDGSFQTQIDTHPDAAIEDNYSEDSMP